MDLVRGGGSVSAARRGRGGGGNAPWGGIPREDAVVDALRGSSRGPLKAKELARELGVPTEAYSAFKGLLQGLERSGRIYRVKGNRYAVPDKINLVVGRVSVIRSGDAFLVVEESGQQDVFVPASDLASAMDGDQAVARIEGRPRGRNPVGRVIKVLERAHPTVVGTYRRSKGFGHVVPQDRRMMKDVLIPEGKDKGAAEKDAVLVRIVSYGDGKLNPVGEIQEVLGPLTDPGVDVLMIHFGYGLPLHFPDDVEQAAERVARERDPSSDPDRVDRTDLHVVTIDPADAKDHDDALSVVRDEDGLWEVGIHIADVSFYVEQGGLVDLEALNRGTSVYLVDRTVPMLPHALSSDVCSLKPDVERAAVSLFARMDDHGRVRDVRFERTLIRSRQRLAYEEAQAVLDGAESVDAVTDDALRRLDALARPLRERREKRGSIDFDLPEARVILGEGGEPVDIERILRLDAHRLVEDFMLLANEIVATEAHQRKLPILYRIHESPTDQKMEALRGFLASLGHTLPKRDIRPKDLQKVIERVRGRPEEKLVSTVILRSMQRARYAPANLGHFGLALDDYCHFTSPIRRYPDLVTHRVVVRALVQGQPVPESWSDELDAVAARSSEREQVATGAERDSVELKKVEYMERHLGDEFTGTVAGVTSFGFFVLLDTVFVEGLVHVNTLDDDYYEFREEEYALVGDRKGRRFRLGDRVRIHVARVDKEERHVDFLLLDVLPSA